MKTISLIFLFLIWGLPVAADFLVPVRTIRPNTLLTADDFIPKSGSMLGVVEDLNEVVGQEARVALYAGRPVRRADVGPPPLVDRNVLVRLVFASGGLAIVTEGRSLGRGAEGDIIRVMNLASRTTLFGEVQSDGSVKVGH